MNLNLQAKFAENIPKFCDRKGGGGYNDLVFTCQRGELFFYL